MIGPLLTVVILLVASALFVAAEFALVSARRSLIEPDAVRSVRARQTIAAMDEVSVMMACAQLGITVCGLVIGAVGEPAVAHLIEPAIRAIGLPAAAVDAIGLAVALLIVVGAHVAFGEMVPKNIALAGPERTAMILAPGLRAVARILGPLVRGLDHLANLIVRSLGVTPTAEVASSFTGAEVAALVAQSVREGLIDPEDEQLVEAALAFETARVRDIAIPDADLVTVGPDPTADDVETACARSGFSRFPVQGAGGGRYCGFVHVRDVLALGQADRTRPIPNSVIRDLDSIDADASLRTALEQMQRTHTHMCRVTGPTGGSGVVLLEDVIEVLVGEIADATRRPRGGSMPGH